MSFYFSASSIDYPMGPVVLYCTAQRNNIMEVEAIPQQYVPQHIMQYTPQLNFVYDIVYFLTFYVQGADNIYCIHVVVLYMQGYCTVLYCIMLYRCCCCSQSVYLTSHTVHCSFTRPSVLMARQERWSQTAVITSTDLSLPTMLSLLCHKV